MRISTHGYYHISEDHRLILIHIYLHTYVMDAGLPNFLGETTMYIT